MDDHSHVRTRLSFIAVKMSLNYEFEGVSVLRPAVEGKETRLSRGRVLTLSRLRTFVVRCGCTVPGEADVDVLPEALAELTDLPAREAGVSKPKNNLERMFGRVV